MKPSNALSKHRFAIRGAVARFKMANPRVFGSTARNDDRDGSDLDLLVDPLPGLSLFDQGALKSELEEMLGVSVDIVVADALHPALRDEILREAAPL